MSEPDAAGQVRCEADAFRRNGWKHFALAERAANFGYWRTSFADGKMFWSPGMYRLLGVDPAVQVPDQVWLMDQVEPEDARHVHKTIMEAVASKSPFYYRTRSRNPEAAVRYVDTHGEVELGPGGNVIAVIGVCHDVTRQVMADAEREKTQQRYRLIAEEASDIILLQENDRTVFTSNAMERLLNRRPEEFQNGNYLKLVHPDDIDEAKKVLGRPPAGQTRTATYRVRHAAGHYIWFEISTRGVLDEATGTFWEISVGRDVTGRKEQEFELRAAQERAEAGSRAKSLFFANMSHELRTPLNAVIGFTDIMCAEMFGPLGNARYREYARLIRTSGKHLLDLIGDILDVAKLDAGKLELSFAPCDLGDTIREGADLLAERARSAGLSLSTEIPDSDLSLIADARALKQIVLNLLSNAVKFTQPGGQVIIGARGEPGEVALFVRDNGIGIPPDALERLGRPFEQVCTDPMLAKGGAGLGLSLVRAFTEKHGGSMRIDSEVGSGTQVTLQLPRRQSARAAV